MSNDVLKDFEKIWNSFHKYKRNVAKIIELRNDGLTFQEIADQFGYSKQNVHSLYRQFCGILHHYLIKKRADTSEGEKVAQILRPLADQPLHPDKFINYLKARFNITKEIHKNDIKVISGVLTLFGWEVLWREKVYGNTFIVYSPASSVYHPNRKELRNLLRSLKQHQNKSILPAYLPTLLNTTLPPLYIMAWLGDFMIYSLPYNLTLPVTIRKFDLKTGKRKATVVY